jgi:hypothetical protein
MEQLRVLRLMIVALLAAAILVLPVAAIDISGQGVNVTAAETPLVGGDKDEHGCIGSAGYTWCEPKQTCLREWEEPCGGAAAATTTEMMPGSDKDEHGCIGSAGYTWCEPKQTCLREWEEPCTAAATAEMTNEATAIPTTKSPLPAFLVIGALGAACVLAAVRKD